jgi:hypothetical protein
MELLFPDMRNTVESADVRKCGRKAGKGKRD